MATGGGSEHTIHKLIVDWFIQGLNPDIYASVVSHKVENGNDFDELVEEAKRAKRHT